MAERLSHLSGIVALTTCERDFEPEACLLALLPFWRGSVNVSIVCVLRDALWEYLFYGHETAAPPGRAGRDGVKRCSGETVSNRSQRWTSWRTEYRRLMRQPSKADDYAWQSRDDCGQNGTAWAPTETAEDLE
ncbi:hypothetical protein PR048_019458 [Dryococelus australis]|uniref:Uncharacterized protein n=1 Tax=Dryococelus australis TaxID=614101 RepID=A0ABQ9H3K0_9NEOP|nr:hypothetical protein PR048_019458 [Dryococelus australis]